LIATDKPPLIRCRYLHDQLKALELLGAGVKQRILERVSKTTLQMIKSTKETQWVPFEFAVEFVDCISAEIGDEGIFNLNIKTFSYSIESSMVGPVFRGALKIFKVNPTTLLMLGPFIWNSICCNCGDLQIVEKDAKHTQVIFKNLPLEIVNKRSYLMGIAGVLQAIFSFTGVEGQVTIESVSEPTQSVTYVGSWK
jgi:hypothetical protein